MTVAVSVLGALVADKVDDFHPPGALVVTVDLGAVVVVVATLLALSTSSAIFFFFNSETISERSPSSEACGTTVAGAFGSVSSSILA